METILKRSLPALLLLAGFVLGVTLRAPVSADGQFFTLLRVPLRSTIHNDHNSLTIDVTRLQSELSSAGANGYHVSGILGNNLVILER